MRCDGYNYNPFIIQKKKILLQNYTSLDRQKSLILFIEYVVPVSISSFNQSKQKLCS